MFSGFLSACESTIDRNYVAKQTYVATDKLISGAGRSISQSTPMLVGTLNDIDYLEMSNTFGRLVSEQISGRLTQKGYNVTELKLRNSLNIKRGLDHPMEAGEFILSRDVQALKAEQQAAAAITGTYAIAGQQVIVNLKMLDVATGKIISATDYSIPLEANTRRLMDMSTPNGGDFYGTSMFYE